MTAHPLTQTKVFRLVEARIEELEKEIPRLQDPKKRWAEEMKEFNKKLLQVLARPLKDKQ